MGLENRVEAVHADDAPDTRQEIRLFVVWICEREVVDGVKVVDDEEAIFTGVAIDAWPPQFPFGFRTNDEEVDSHWRRGEASCSGVEGARERLNDLPHGEVVLSP